MEWIVALVVVFWTVVYIFHGDSKGHNGYEDCKAEVTYFELSRKNNKLDKLEGRIQNSG